MSQAPTAPDLFLSYRRTQASAVAPWVHALRKAGVDVWQDTREIDALDDFSAEIADALSRSRALLVWYSADYPDSIPCQWELTAAFIAAQRSGQPMRRIFIVNPEADARHIVLPAELENSNYLQPVAGGEASFVATIGARLDAIKDSFGAVRPEAPPEWWPHKPPAAPNFIGRQRDLWKLQSLLLKGSDTTVTAAAPAGRICIRGLGGMGKSLLAQQYALRFGWAWPGGLYWFDGRGGNRVAADGYSLRSELEPQFSALARDFGIRTEGMDADFLRGLVRQRLNERGGAYLWIIDDVPPGVPLNELSTWSAPTALGKTLVSTRSSQYRLVDGELELLGLRAEPARLLLASRRAPDGGAERDAAARIVELLGGYPLAIEVAAAAIDSAFSATPYADFLGALRDTNDDALAVDPADLDQLPTGHDRSVVHTLMGSIRLLDETARRVLLLASQVGDAALPFDLITRVLGDTAGPMRNLEAAVKALESHALARRDTQARALSVHAIVNYVVRRWTEQAKEALALRPRIADALADMLGDVDDSRRHPQIVPAIALARALSSGSEADTRLVPLYLKLARFDLAVADYAAAERSALAVQQAVADDDAAPGRESVLALNVLSDIRYAKGRYPEAAQLARQAIELAGERLGDEDPDTLTAKDNLAGALKAQGDLAGARELQESVLVTRRHVLGEEHQDTLTSMNNLAASLWSQGDLTGAQALEESALAARRRVLGVEHPHTLSSINNLASTLYAQGDLAGARALNESALATRRRVLGEEHPDTLSSMGNLASTLQAQGDLAGARALEESVLATFHRVHGQEHPYTLTAMNNLAETIFAQGDLARAGALHESALATRRRVLGEEHPETLTSMNNMAIILKAQGDLAGARALHESALVAFRRLLGEEHPDTLTSMSNLASTLKGQGELAGARALQESVLGTRRRVLGEEHPDTLKSAAWHADNLWHLGEHEAAAKQMRGAAEGLALKLGPDHQNALATRQAADAMERVVAISPGKPKPKHKRK